MSKMFSEKNSGIWLPFMIPFRDLTTQKTAPSAGIYDKAYEEYLRARSYDKTPLDSFAIIASNYARDGRAGLIQNASTDHTAIARRHVFYKASQDICLYTPSLSPDDLNNLNFCTKQDVRLNILCDTFEGLPESWVPVRNYVKQAKHGFIGRMTGAGYQTLGQFFENSLTTGFVVNNAGQYCQSLSTEPPTSLANFERTDSKHGQGLT